MLTAAQIVFLLLLFLLLYFSLHTGLIHLLRRRKTRFRLQYVREERLSRRLVSRLENNHALYRHIAELLESVRSSVTIGMFLTGSLVLVLAGFLTGVLIFRTLKGALVMSLLPGSLPYLILRMRLIGLQLRARLEFLPAVEVFYQYYVLSGEKNVRIALQGCLEENRMLYPMRPVFEQLHRNLAASRGVDYSLRIFSLALGHLWAQYFANILRVALLEGNAVGENLRDLITDMRKAQRADQAERNRLLEIRLANFTPALFLAVFLVINFRINYESSYLYYLADPAGRNLLLDSLVLIFASFVMGIYLSMRRM